VKSKNRAKIAKTPTTPRKKDEGFVALPFEDEIFPHDARTEPLSLNG